MNISSSLGSASGYDSSDSFIAPEFEDGGEWSGLSQHTDTQPYDAIICADPDSAESGDSSQSDESGNRSLWRWHLTRYDTAEVITSNAGQRDFSALLALSSKKWVFQVEKGAGGTRLHFQARVSLKVRACKNTVRKLFPGCFVTCESTKAGDTGAGEFYCMKPDTRQAGPWTDKDVVPYIDDQYMLADHLFPWQEEALRLIDCQSKRQILIVVDPAGRSGKTCMAHFICLCLGGKFVPPFCQSGDDVLKFVHGLVRPGEQYTIVIDIPRALDWNRFAPALFSAFETIKGGYVYDTRYRAQVKYIKPPKMICFCNHVPDPRLLTKDRWTVLRLPFQGPLMGETSSQEESSMEEPGSSCSVPIEIDSDSDESVDLDGAIVIDSE